MTDMPELTRVILENEYLKVTVLPQLGGKTASIIYKDKGFELCAQPDTHPYILPERCTLFSQGDSSGFDDCFPTIVAGILPEAPGFSYTDHGEIWRSCFDWKVNGQSIRMNYSSGENSFSYDKCVALDGNALIYHYSIRNDGDEVFPCLWAMHALVRYEKDMILLYPSSVKSFLNVEENRMLGCVGTVHVPGESSYDFNTVPDTEQPIEGKYYVNGKVTEGWCGYVYPSQGIRCEIVYDAEKLPYLGFWVTAGGYRGEYNCAWEPSTGFYDDIVTAKAHQSLILLKPGEVYDFSIRVCLMPKEQKR